MNSVELRKTPVETSTGRQADRKEVTMSHNPFENQTEQRDPSLLQSRPQREGGWRKGRTLPIVMLLVGAVIIIGAGTVLAVVLASRGSAASSSNTTNSTITNKQANSNCGQEGHLPPVYWNTLLQQAAQGLHLSVAQVTARIKGGKSIQDVASEQGISAQQLQSIEISALHAANNQMVAMQCESQANANANVQYYVNKGPQDMNDRFTHWFATA